MTLNGLSFTPAATFHKRSHSALIGSGLDVWLTQHGIGRVITSGIRSEQCCETTTRHASDLGYRVDYVTEATSNLPDDRSPREEMESGGDQGTDRTCFGRAICAHRDG